MPKMCLLDYFLNRVIMLPSRQFLKKGLISSHFFLSVSLAGIGLWELLRSESVRKPASRMCTSCLLLHIPSEFAFKMHTGCKINLNEPLYSGV